MTNREFFHSSALESAVELLIQNYDSPEPINIGTGVSFSIKELADLIAKITVLKGAIAWNTIKPDGTSR